MTANQIEYWKLQETRRHNLEVEGMDKPLKEAQTKKEYASIGLIQEQTRTQTTQQALNLANAEAARASAAASYAAAEANYAAARLSEARTITETYNQNLLGLEAENQSIRNAQESLILEQSQVAQPGALALAGMGSTVNIERARQITSDSGQVYLRAAGQNFMSTFDVSGDNLIKNATSVITSIIGRKK